MITATYFGPADQGKVGQKLYPRGVPVEVSESDAKVLSRTPDYTITGMLPEGSRTRSSTTPEEE